jgi:hypothetical protein
LDELYFILRFHELSWTDCHPIKIASTLNPIGENVKFELKTLRLVINKVICKVTLPFTPYPIFQGHPQSNEILLNLGMKAETQHLVHKVRE